MEDAPYLWWSWNPMWCHCLTTLTALSWFPLCDDLMARIFFTEPGSWERAWGTHVMSKPQDSHHSLSVFSSRWFDGKDHLYRTNLQVKKFWIYKKEYGEPIYVHSITASRPSPLSLSLFFHIQKPGHMVSIVLWHSSFSLEVSSFRWFDGKNLGFLFKMIWWQGSSLQNKLTYYRVLISATTK